MFATGLQIGPFRSSAFNGVTLRPNTAALASARPQAASKLSIRAEVKMAEGVVVSNKMAKTVAVEVGRYQVHPKYGKRYRVTKKYIAHDENEECEVGDYVQLAQIAPMSKRKTWKMAKILKKVVKI